MNGSGSVTGSPNGALVAERYPSGRRSLNKVTDLSAACGSISRYSGTPPRAQASRLNSRSSCPLLGETTSATSRTPCANSS